MRTATQEEGSTHTAAMLHGLHYYLKKHWHMRRAAHTAGRKWDSWIWVSLLPILRIFSTSCHFGGILAAAHYSIKGTHHLLYMGMRSRTQQVSVGFHEEGTIGKLPYTIRERERTHNFEKKKPPNPPLQIILQGHSLQLWRFHSPCTLSSKVSWNVV